MIEYLQIVSAASKVADVEEARYLSLVGCFFNELLLQLEKGNDVAIHKEIGNILLRERNVATTGGIIKKRRFTPIFKESAALKRRLTQSDEEYIDALAQNGFTEAAENIRKVSAKRNEDKILHSNQKIKGSKWRKVIKTLHNL